MKIVTRNAFVRMAVLLLVLWGAALYMTIGPRAGKQIMTPPNISVAALRSHVEMLAGTIGERNYTNYPALHQAADYIEQQWQAQGYRVTRQTYTAEGVECANLEVSVGNGGLVVVVGAHYDSILGSPGANDNASGVAALLELSRVFAGRGRAGARPSTIRFVAFVNEEPPFFRTELQGSRVYARACRERSDDIRAMIALETMGCFSDEPGSQKFPSLLFRMFYPSRGNFIGFVSNFGSRGVMREAAAAFRAHSDFPVECCSTYSKIAGIGWSDHASFWHEGYRAFMVTDTAPFRYPHYHEETDTPDKVNYEALARITAGLCGTVAALAGKEP